MSLKNIVVVSVLKHLSEIDSMCRLDKHSAHPNPQMTHTGTHRHAQARTHAHTHTLEGTQTQVHTEEGKSGS